MQASTMQDRSRTMSVEVVEEYALPGHDFEIAGVMPHPSDDDLYMALACFQANYPLDHDPKLAPEFRGNLLTIDKHTGEVVRTIQLVEGGDYGGLAYGEGHIFAASLFPPEILKIEPESGDIVARFAVSSPVGGLEYDAQNRRLIAQTYIGFPHLAVMDPDSGETSDTLWSDESAMGLAVVGGDLLCIWTGRAGPDDIVDPKSESSELRLLNPETGRVMGITPLEGVHTAMAPLDPEVAGMVGFISLARNGEGSDNPGKASVRRYRYVSAN